MRRVNTENNHKERATTERERKRERRQSEQESKEKKAETERASEYTPSNFESLYVRGLPERGNTWKEGGEATLILSQSLGKAPQFTAPNYTAFDHSLPLLISSSENCGRKIKKNVHKKKRELYLDLSF